MQRGRGLRMVLEAARAGEAWFAVLLRALMVATGLLLTALMVAEVFLRYVLESPFLGAEELSVLLGLWLFAAGMAYASRENVHIAGGVLAVLPIGPRARKALKILGMAVCVVVAAIYAYFGFTHTYETFGSTRISAYMRWPFWIWTASLFVGFALMTAYFVLGVARAWRMPAAESED